MATEMKIWRVNNKNLELLHDPAIGPNVEKDLENWIESDPTFLGEDLLVVARQPNIPGIGIPDLLCIDGNGVPVVVELKRKSIFREAIGQALDYASWLDSSTPEQFADLAAEHFRKSRGQEKSLAQAFSEHFPDDLPELDLHDHRIILVAPELEIGAERIINYLAERYQIGINAVFFKYAKLGSEEILVRSVFLSEETTLRGPGKKRRKASPPENLPEIAKERQVDKLVEVCRRVRTEAKWDEGASDVYGGSWVYSLRTDKGWRSLIGINVSGQLMPTPPRAPEFGRLDKSQESSRSNSCERGRNPECSCKPVFTSSSKIRKLHHSSRDHKRLRKAGATVERMGNGYEGNGQCIIELPSLFVLIRLLLL